jgi:hypothetical protein
MAVNKSDSIEVRIIGIHQPYIRPIVRGKANAKMEFSTKLTVNFARF